MGQDTTCPGQWRTIGIAEDIPSPDGEDGFLSDNAHTFLVASNTTYTHYASARRTNSI